ncbi:MAG: hypothetical protein AAB706_00665 [Patescibacteria group bacterium]
MIEMFKYEKRPQYPHMSPSDTEIWNRYIDKFPNAYLTCQYDFHIGDTAPFNTLMDDGTDLNQDKLYRLRIDVVAADKEKISVIEVKPNAGVSALGQLEKYTELFIRDETPFIPVDMVLITDKELPNIDYLCKKAGVKLIIV